MISCACLCGVALYGYYANCDPLKFGSITKTDQLMPFFVMQELRDYPGLAGLFVSCVFSASLSTMSSGFNALATVTYDDFLSQTNFLKQLPEKRVQQLSKLIAFAYGMAAIAMAFVVSQINSILEVYHLHYTHALLISTNILIIKFSSNRRPFQLQVH